MIQVVAAIIIKNDQLLLSKRLEHSHQGGKWEFPGGKVESNESLESALARELKEEINIEIKEPIFFDEITFDYSEKSVHLHFFLVSQFSGEPQGLEGQQVEWFSINQIKDLEFPAANKAIVRKLLSQFIKIDQI